MALGTPSGITKEQDFTDLRASGASLAKVAEKVNRISQETTLDLNTLKGNIKELTKNHKDNLVVSNKIITDLNGGGLTINKGDELGYINTLTVPGNKIKWGANKIADLIYPGEVVKIKIEADTGNVYVHNSSEKRLVGTVDEGFTMDNVLVPKEEKKKKEGGDTMPPDDGNRPSSNDPEDKPEEKAKPKKKEGSDTTPPDDGNRPSSNDPEDKPEIRVVPSIETTPIIARVKEGLQHDNFEQGVITEDIKLEEQLQKKYPKVFILKDITDIWADAAQKEASSEMFNMFKIGKTDTEVLTEQIFIVQSLMAEIINKASNGEEVTNQEIEKVFQEMYVAERAEMSISNLAQDYERTEYGTIAKDSNNNPILVAGKIEKELNRVKVYDPSENQLSVTNYGEQREKILNLMRVRYGGIQEGNSTMVTSKLTDTLINKPDFSDIKDFYKIKDILDNPELLTFIKMGNLTHLTVALKIPKDIAENIIKSYTSIKRLQNANRTIFQDIVRQRNPGLDNTDPSHFNDLVDKSIKRATNESTKDLLKKSLLFDTLENKPELASQYSDYSDMVGVGNFTFSDNKITAAVDLGLFLASSAIPFGIAFKAANAVSKGVNILGKGTARLGSRAIPKTLAKGTAKFMSKTPKRIAAEKNIKSVLGLTGFAADAAVKGVAFYETTNVFHNAMYEKHYTDLTNGAGDTTEMVKATAFFGVMGTFGKIMNGAKITSLHQRLPLPTIRKGIARATEAGLILGAGNEIERWTKDGDEKDDVNYTVEGYIEALMMAIIAKRVGGINNKKGQKQNNKKNKPFRIGKNKKLNTYINKRGINEKGLNSLKYTKDGALVDLKSKKLSALIKRRDLVNKQVSKGNNSKSEIGMANNEVRLLEKEINARHTPAKSAKESFSVHNSKSTIKKHERHGRGNGSSGRPNRPR